MSALPVPSKPYPDWSRFLRAVIEHGMDVNNIDPGYVEWASNLMPQLIRDAMCKRNEAKKVRPSAFLACARQTYLLADGAPMADMPGNIGSTFAVGHLLHLLTYAAVRSALPPCFEVAVELEVALPEWWPDDPRFNQRGTVDMLIHKMSEAGNAYLPSDAPRSMLCDVKSMGGYSMRKHKKTLFGEDPDGFGYLSQLTVYADSPDVKCLDTGVTLIGINRDSLTQPPAPRFVAPEILQGERNRLQAAIGMALDSEDPGEEFLRRHGDEAHFFCGKGGREGYCPARVECAKRPYFADAEGNDTIEADPLKYD